jgi:hypothetical protein
MAFSTGIFLAGTDSPLEFLACYFLFFGVKRTRLDEESQKEQVNQNRQVAKWEFKNENRVGNEEFGRNSCIFICDLVLVLASDGEMSGWKLEWFMLIDFYGLLDRNWKEWSFMTLKFNILH